MDDFTRRLINFAILMNALNRVQLILGKWHGKIINLFDAFDGDQSIMNEVIQRLIAVMIGGGFRQRKRFL